MVQVVIYEYSQGGWQIVAVEVTMLMQSFMVSMLAFLLKRYNNYSSWNPNNSMHV